jgi:hypothetical protein
MTALANITLEAWLMIAGLIGGQVISFVVFLVKLDHRLKQVEKDINGLAGVIKTQRWQAEHPETDEQAKKLEIEIRKKRLKGEII